MEELEMLRERLTLLLTTWRTNYTGDSGYDAGVDTCADELDDILTMKAPNIRYRIMETSADGNLRKVPYRLPSLSDFNTHEEAGAYIANILDDDEWDHDEYTVIPVYSKREIGITADDGDSHD